MRFSRLLLRTLIFLVVLTASGAATAGPARCSYGNQDSTCVTPLTTAWQAAPTCSTDPGWTTVGAAQWIGSKWTSPSCSYQPAPTCPGGFTQTSAPWWNGSSWVGLGCQPSIPPDPTPACSAAIPSGYYPSSAWSQDTDPQIRSYDDYVAAYTGISGYSTVYSLNADGPTYSLPCYDRNNYRGRCYVGANNSVIAIIMTQASSASSGQCNH